MKRLLLSTFFLFTYIFAQAADTTKVLFIGNSFTGTFDVPQLVKGFADAAALPMVIASHTPGGISVADVSQGTMAHMNNPMVFDLIRSNNWDYVVLQDNQGRFVDGGGNFPSPTQSPVIAGHIKIRDSMRANSSCSRMLLFSGWAWKSGYPGLGDGKKLIANIYENYQVLNTSAQEIIAPIGSAWLRAITQVPSVDLWGPDEAHQSMEGSYITAAVIFSSIYRMNTETVMFDNGMDTSIARKLRRIAYETVSDSIKPTKLNSFIPTLAYTGTTLTAPTGYTKYQWFKNNTLMATTTTNTYTVIAGSSDCYQVMVTNNNGCTQRSALVCKPTTGIDNIYSQEQITISPNPANDFIVVNNVKNNKPFSYTIAALSGSVVMKGKIDSNNTPINISTLSAGTYYISINIADEIKHIRFIKQ